MAPRFERGPHQHEALVAAWGCQSLLDLGAEGPIAVGDAGVSDDGADPRILASLSAAHLAAYGSDLFSGSGTSILRMSRSGSDAGLNVVAEPVGRLAGLAVDANHVCRMDDSGSLFTIPQGVVGAQPQRLASNQAAGVAAS